ncbi:hypothetical protein ACT7C3_11160 [Bacillus pacificus]
MQIQGEGRNQFAYVNDQKVALTNDTLRDAYRQHYSKEERQQLTEVEQELASIDIKIYQTKDAWETAKESADLVKSKSICTSKSTEVFSIGGCYGSKTNSD